jgi:flagellar basal body P-ring formation protein FlgA
VNKKKIYILVLTLVVFKTGYTNQQFQSHNSIYEFVKNTVVQNITATEYEISVLPLDSQLKLPACQRPLEAFAISAMNVGRTAIGVRCDAEKKWSIFITAIIQVYETVVVLAQPVQRGEIITLQHLATEKRDVSKLRGNFITLTEQIENKQAARYLSAGTILGLNSFVEPKAIKRGDKIIISARQPDFTIRVEGVAMMDGIKGQRIRVKNENSGRIINATVMESGVVVVE